MSKLLPCPFCCGRQTYRKHDGGVWLTTTNHKRGCIMRDALAFVAFNTEAEAIAAWNTRAMGGTLTAEQVREVLLYHLPHREYFSIERTDAWQLIADELNTRAERTCKVAACYDTADVDSCGSNAEWYFAFTCGDELYWDEPEPPKYCPNCGAKVIGD